MRPGDEAAEEVASTVRWLERIEAARELLDAPDAPEAVRIALAHMSAAEGRLWVAHREAAQRVIDETDARTATHFGGAA